MRHADVLHTLWLLLLLVEDGACWLGTRTRTLTEEIASERVYRRECGSNRSLICIGHKLNLLTLLPPLLTHRSFKRL